MKAFRNLCKLYVIWIVVGVLVDIIIALTTDYGVRSGLGCNFYDALLVGVECRDFWGASTVAFILNWPLVVLVYAPMLVSASLWAMLIVIFLWFPFGYLLTSYWKNRRKNRAS